MKIYKVLVDEKPVECIMCPLKNSGIKLDLQCGKQYTYKHGNWITTTWVPDERCKFEEVK